MQLSKVFGIITLSILLVGCAAGNENVFWSPASEGDMAQSSYESEAVTSDDSSSGPEFSTSQVSAAAGAALGAGLGAVVGSATGNAGEGLAIGAVAGAASGALVGNEFQKRDEIIQEQREILARQEEVIKAQGGNIEEIRRSLEDRFPENRPSISPSIPLDQYKGNPNAKPFAGSGITPRARMDSTTLAANTATNDFAVRNDSPRRKDSPNLGAVASNTRSPEPKKVAAIPAPKPIPTAKLDTPAPKKEIVRAVPAPEVKEIGSKPKAEVAKPEPVKAVASAPEKKEMPAPSAVAKMTTAETTGCKEATDEARRAEEAVSEADKLFYYRRAARLCPVEASYRVKIGQVYATLGKKDQAKGEFEKALEIDPENVIANEELSLLESNISY